jgi:hypothetical protein
MFCAWDVLRVGPLVMGRFESGTFRDGTFCMCTVSDLYVLVTVSA